MWRTRCGNEGVPSAVFKDIFVLCDSNQYQLEHLSCSFIWFEAIMSLKINLEKSLPIEKRKKEKNQFEEKLIDPSW